MESICVWRICSYDFDDRFKCSIRLDENMTTAFFIAKVNVGEEQEIGEELASFGEVSEVYTTTGEYDLLAKVETKKPDAAISLMTKKIRSIEGITGTRTFFAKKIK